ncbi:site-specific DNA-methyltransferase [Dysgonomonas sp. HDW5A]|uniref:site-specific DNA-methyltransferase n=1 Tax=Dysgonomonas sp. HDW5A TaxID=2714926 RepID=UPI00140B2E51|nr:site-specific DNA-methyltransferase [Dysgonomonas sp. HDW5A]QIK59683.1 site-specific DNA-methyltransferase [Dysgonomonas sp. HDW5A]
MDGKSLDIVQDNIEKLKQLFPNIFSEGKIDFARLKQELGEDVLTKGEHYELSWAGKSEARLEIQKRTTATLIPDKEGSVDFDTAQNIFIEGENLETLRVLQQSYFGRVKMIYIDPPYNTGNDSFVYPDDYSERRDDYQKRTNIIDEEGYLNKQDLWRKNTKENGQYHSAWLSMMYPRLYIARNLLREDGVIFISIGEDEISNIKLLCDEIFGEENCITIFSRLMKSGGAKGRFITPNIDYILAYTKNILLTNDFRSILKEDQIERYYNKTEISGAREGQVYGEERLYKASLDPRANQRYWIKCPDGTFVIPPGVSFPERLEEGEKIAPTSEDGVWKWIYDRYKSEYNLNNIVFKETSTSALIDSTGKQSKWNIYNKLWLEEQKEKGVVPSNFISEFENRQSAKELKDLEIPFDFAKPKDLIKYLLQISKTDEDALILDFFAGSGTTAQAVMELNEEDGGNRRFICVQMPELLEEKDEAYKAGYRTIADICKERIHRSIAKIEKEREGKLEFETKQKLAFAAYKLKPSNFKIWQSDADKMDLAQQLIDFTQSERAESLPQNMLIELLLKNEKEALTINYSFEDGFYKTQKTWFCFEAYVKQQKELLTAGKPQEVIYLNSCFTSDEDLTNLKLELQENNIKLTLV